MMITEGWASTLRYPCVRNLLIGIDSETFPLMHHAKVMK